ncbi:NAD-dependent glycerol-3-phosphate dehydrogenase family protein [Candidatus Phytoplasma oryzae]|uniref:Glycerol-3-phosphate dehydrogenase [NAD(P)+] n=1 Tax=Candidatus Phytoplasma oryzae TaxID=203274 RepID=A0A139JRB3_9MOLU|nr:NAD(P)H-dependent glycerol-3-phosphate dehydrogenase [Candidatus Phytoplasma oryzae]KXT29390.1 NAD-dependent glycerol-3-phosphate dehydrogenase family protein [Candidatus Phytoplasma oryzae]RAM57973.1 glycerol-3-phosphate dehydrogenase [Candidatus Phytoplasma oryzae]
MTKITIIGGGAWGATLGQVLTDNQNEILIYDINEKYIEKINNQKHPIFNLPLYNIKVSNNLEKAINFSNIIIICIPAQKIRNLLKKINKIIKKPKNFINVSKGIEIINNKIIYKILQEEIKKNKIKNYACLLGPSHAEEVILRKKTFLTTASYNKNFAKKVCSLFNNEYFQVNTSLDVIGCEICSAFKNALALISGILDNELFDKNAKAAFITFGIKEMQKILLLFKTNPDTSINLAGLGDLIVTAFNNNSRNYKAGRQISLGKTLKEIYKNNNQVIEGIDNLKVFYKLSKIKNIELPIIHSSFQVIFKKKPIKKIINTIFNKIKFY